MSGSGEVERGGHHWEVGTEATVAWIQHGTDVGMAITSLVPPLFEAYATVVDPWCETFDPLLKNFDRLWSSDIPDGAWLEPEHEVLRAGSRGWQVQEQLVEILAGYGSRSWWLGYLDRGEGVGFGRTSPTRLYVGWPYRLVKAGPEQALSWQVTLPDLMFPEDHTWCFSTGWDDSWTCLGGPTNMIARLCDDSIVAARQVDVDQDATPPGHIAI